jgi:hypothetical protein
VHFYSTPIWKPSGRSIIRLFESKPMSFLDRINSFAWAHYTQTDWQYVSNLPAIVATSEWPPKVPSMTTTTSRFGEIRPHCHELLFQQQPKEAFPVVTMMMMMLARVEFGVSQSRCLMHFRKRFGTHRVDRFETLSSKRRS